MKLIKAIVVLLFCVLQLQATQPREEVNINFQGLKINDFIKLVSNILNKNILIQKEIKGTVEFISTTTVYKDQISNILLNVLHAKGYTLIEQNGFLEVVRTSEAVKMNLPVYNSNETNYKAQMITKSILIKGQNVDAMASKVRHFLSKSAKLVTIKENNSILVTDYPDNVKTVEGVLRIIEKSSLKDVRYYKLKHISAKDALKSINKVAKNLFNFKIEQEKVDLLENAQDNSIIAVGLRKNLETVAGLVESLDTPQKLVERRVEIIQLKNSDAKNIAKVVTNFLAKSKSSTKAKKGVIDTGKTKISYDEDTNSLIASGTLQELKKIKFMVKLLDKEKQQVFVKAKVLEISENRVKQIGIKYGFEGGFSNSGGLYSFGGNLGGSSIAVGSTLSSKFIDSGSISKGLALGATINFLQTNNASNIISQPSLLCINNKESSIYVGQTESILTNSTSSTSTATTTQNSYSREDIGLTLKIKPRISDHQKVTLDIEIKTEDVASGSGGGTPTTTKREVKTTAMVKSGESVIIGGLIRTKFDDAKTKVPLLGDIPLLGALFRDEQDTFDRQNILILLTPYVLEKATDLSRLQEDLTELERIQKLYNKRFKENLKELNLEKDAFLPELGKEQTVQTNFSDNEIQTLFEEL